MKNKNSLLVFCSVVVGICAAIAATLVVLNFLKKKKERIETTDYMFENDFDDDGEDIAPVTEE